MKLENLFKGWALSIIGLIGIIFITLHVTGVYVFPNPAFLNSTTEVLIGFTICFALFLLPKGKLEAFVEKLANKLLGKSNESEE